MQTRTWHKKHYRSQIRGYTQCNGSSTVDKTFLSAQGQNVSTTMIYWANKSTVLLAKNRKASSSRSTCNLDVSFICDGQNPKRWSKINVLSYTWRLGISLQSHYKEHYLHVWETVWDQLCTGVCWMIEKMKWRKMSRKKQMPQSDVLEWTRKIGIFWNYKATGFGLQD